MTPDLQELARHARYLMFRSARLIASRFKPSVLDWMALCWRRRDPSVRIAAATQPINPTLELSRSQDVEEGRITDHDCSKPTNDATATNDCDIVSLRARDDVEQNDGQRELRVTVDSVCESALEENEGRTRCSGDSEDTTSNRCDEKDQRAVKSREVREAWPSSPTGEETNGMEASGKEVTPAATMLPQAATATLLDTPDLGCPFVSDAVSDDIRVHNEGSDDTTPQLVPIFNPAAQMEGKPEVRASHEAQEMAQLVSMYEVYLRCTLQV